MAPPRLGPRYVTNSLPWNHCLHYAHMPPHTTMNGGYPETPTHSTNQQYLYKSETTCTKSSYPMVSQRNLSTTAYLRRGIPTGCRKGYLVQSFASLHQQFTEPYKVMDLMSCSDVRVLNLNKMDVSIKAALEHRLIAVPSWSSSDMNRVNWFSRLWKIITSTQY